MKYFLDTEFIEGAQTKWFGLTKPTIDLISIGIVAEDGSEYYAVSKDFNLKEAWNRFDLVKKNRFQTDGETYYEKVYWIRDNVLFPIYIDYVHGDMRNHIHFTYKNMKGILKGFGKSNKQIAEEVYEFCSNDYHKGNNLSFVERKKYDLYDKFKPVFYGYYSDYDWVVFCWLFGKMIELPKGFPMYCKDLKQISDEVYQQKKKEVLDEGHKKGMKLCFLNSLSEHLEYPKQTNEHNALADARWNKELYEFLNKV